MRELSDKDGDAIIRLLRWAALQGDGSTADREYRRRVSYTLKKLERKWKRKSPK